MLYISGEIPDIGDLVTDRVHRSGTVQRLSCCEHTVNLIIAWDNGTIGINHRPEKLTLIRRDLKTLGIFDELAPQ